jgi:hypothetical protein
VFFEHAQFGFLGGLPADEFTSSRRAEYPGGREKCREFRLQPLFAKIYRENICELPAQGINSREQG